jgi:intergrase/recombinase
MMNHAVKTSLTAVSHACGVSTVSSLFPSAVLSREHVRLGSLARWGVTLVRNNNNDLLDFKKWLEAREYAKTYIDVTMSFAMRYSYILENGNLSELDTLTTDKKASAIKALILLSKWLGIATQFKQELEKYGIKIVRPSSLASFLRLFNANGNDTIKWYNEARSNLRDNEQLFAKFLLQSGLRTSEAIRSFNMIISLSKQNKLTEYYDQGLNVLCHFKYPKIYIRRTKACYITFIKPEFLNEIATSKTVTYSMLRKRLERKRMKLKFNELRDKFGTYLLNHGILEAEINLCQGRIPVDIFIRHYWSPKLTELGNRIFKALETIETV